MRLPSGKEIALIPVDLFEHGGNWFAAKPDHFWYWSPDLTLNAPPFSPNQDVLTEANQGSVPVTPYEAGMYVRVLEMVDGDLVWRGEMYHSFPEHTELSEEDLQAWQELKVSKQVENWLRNLMAKCRQLAELTEAQMPGSPPRTSEDDEIKNESMELYGLPRLPHFQDDPEYLRCMEIRISAKLSNQLKD